MTADAFNNLSDAGSSVITLIGFKLAAEKPDKEHPFGHGRFEYISGLIVSLVIMLMGFELAKSSFDKILHPEAVDASLLTFAVLAVSIGIKLYMSAYNRTIGAKIDSVSMKATAADSTSDVAATSVVFLVTLFSAFSDLNLDGYCGLAVSFFILYTGFNAARDTIGPLARPAAERGICGGDSQNRSFLSRDSRHSRFDRPRLRAGTRDDFIARRGG